MRIAIFFKPVFQQIFFCSNSKGLILIFIAICKQLKIFSLYQRTNSPYSAHTELFYFGCNDGDSEVKALEPSMTK